jgi:2-phospho-L-lactate guanylyltransferase
MTESVVNTAALIAVRRGAKAKTRLANMLDGAARARLMRMLLERVVSAAQMARGVDGVFIVSPQAEDLPTGCEVLLDDGSGHSEAVTQAVRELAARGVTELLILPADLASVAPADLETLLEAGRSAGGAIAPDRHGTGTNAFYLKLPAAIPFAFGPGSCARHRAALRDAGIEPAVVYRPGLALDIDAPEDLALARCGKRRRRRTHA